jgi:hypothetical protein
MNPLLSNKNILEDLIIETATYFNLSQVYIEKDFHVYLMLKSIADSPYAESAIFKGGTALSRVWKLTERFSEDVDICVNPKAKSSFTQLKYEKDFIADEVAKTYPKIDDHKDEKKGGHIRKTIHPFPKVITSPQSMDINENIVLEITAVRPTTTILHGKELIDSYIGEFLKAISKNELVEQFDIKPFVFSVMMPEHTLGDKLCRMIKLANSEDSVTQIGSKVRDLYDIHKLLQNKRVRNVFNSEKFVEIFNHAVQEENRNGETIRLFSETPLFSNPNEVLELQKDNYKKITSMIFGTPPTLTDIAKTLIENFGRFRELDKANL